MPSSSSTLAKWMPAVAPASDRGNRWRRPRSSAERSAAASPTGGRGSPARTAIAVRTTPMSGGRAAATWPVRRQLRDQGRGQDQQVGRRAAEELVAHGADRAEACRRCRMPVSALNWAASAVDEALGRAAAQDLQLHIGSPQRHGGDDALARDRQVAHAHAERRRTPRCRSPPPWGCARTRRRPSASPAGARGSRPRRRARPRSAGSGRSPRCRW